MTRPQPDIERLQNLLAEQALFELSASDQQELQHLLRAAGNEIDPETYERVAALLAAATLADPMPDCPQHLMEKLRSDAHGHFSKPPHLNSPSSADSQKPKIGSLRREAIAWLLAAACAALLILRSWPTPPEAPGKVDYAVARTQFLEKAPDVIQADWTATQDPAASGVSGDVVWSDAEQSGFMRFRGLPANNATQDQYQLWIFDSKQDPRYPVDGGVFDIPSNGEAIIPIHAKLHVSNPQMFAITVEKPGGVVVSDRSRIVVLAKVVEAAKQAHAVPPAINLVSQ